MSDPNDTQIKLQRKIKIKPLDYFKSGIEAEDLEANEAETIKNQVEQMKYDIDELNKRKQQLLEDTQTAIEKEKDMWREEKQQLMEAAKQEGYQAGFEEGKAESLEVYRSALEQANHIVDLVKADYQKTLEKTEDVIVQLAVHTAEKILQKQLEEEPELYMNIVRAALKEIKNQAVISIYLHPANYELVLDQKAELKRILEHDTKLSLYINEDLAENACIIEHPFGQIDASVDTQLEQIRSALNELVMESEDEA